MRKGSQLTPALRSSLAMLEVSGTSPASSGVAPCTRSRLVKSKDMPSDPTLQHSTSHSDGTDVNGTCSEGPFQAMSSGAHVVVAHAGISSIIQQ